MTLEERVERVINLPNAVHSLDCAEITDNKICDCGASAFNRALTIVKAMLGVGPLVRQPGINSLP